MRLGASILGFAVLFSVHLQAERQILYETVTKGESIKTVWNLEKTENKMQIKGLKKGKDVNMECSADFRLESYEEKTSESKFFSIAKLGPCLIVKNTDKGKERTLSHKIGKMPWIQDFTFGFQDFVRSEKKSCEFCIVYPKDLALHEMIATKEGEEEVKIGEKKYKVQRVKITLTGFKKQFWKANALFDKETGILVQYRANEGPRTPYIETSLLQM